MSDRTRLRKKLEEARRLRDVEPSESLAMGMDLSEFARRLFEAADRARP